MHTNLEFSSLLGNRSVSKSIDVLFVATEVEPFVKTGSLADLAGNMPKNVKSMGHEIRVMLPGYGSINERRYHLHNLLRMQGIEIPIGNTCELAYVKSSYINCDNKKVQVYFLSNERYFNRQGLYFHPETKEHFIDNDERFIFFARGVLETLKRLGWQPRIIHCNDWQCGLIPAYLKTLYKDDPFFKNTRTVFTAYSLASHGTFSRTSYLKTGLPPAVLLGNDIDSGKLDFLKAGLTYADVITTIGMKADKRLFSSSKNGIEEMLHSHNKHVVSLTPTSQNGDRYAQLAEKFVSIYRDLVKNG
jgi:starch synthase